MADQLLTVEQAASRLHLRPSTIRRQLRDGALRGIKRGHVWRVPESAIYSSSDNSPRPVAEAEALWQEIVSGDNNRRSAAIIALASVPDAVRELVQERSGRAAARYYATVEAEAEFADLRAIEGEPFEGFDDD